MEDAPRSGGRAHNLRPKECGGGDYAEIGGFWGSRFAQAITRRGCARHAGFNWDQNRSTHDGTLVLQSRESFLYCMSCFPVFTRCPVQYSCALLACSTTLSVVRTVLYGIRTPYRRFSETTAMHCKSTHRHRTYSLLSRSEQGLLYVRVGNCWKLEILLSYIFSSFRGPRSVPQKRNC